MTDAELIARAELAGWIWQKEHTWYGGIAVPGWLVPPTTIATTPFYPCEPENKAKYLRGKKIKVHGKKCYGFDHSFDCHECGQPIWFHWMCDLEERMIENRECFECHTWLNIIRLRPNNNDLIMDHDGDLIIDNSDAKQRWCYGRREFDDDGGEEITVRLPDGTIFETSDLWCFGLVPGRFHDRLPVNAEFYEPPEELMRQGLAKHQRLEGGRRGRKRAT
jgi:hypothetical protein